jgi:hypothetical protein
MTRLNWGTPGERFFEAGVDRGVLYTGVTGVPWNGLISVTEAPDGGSAKPFYLDGVKYMNRTSNEEFKATISAFTYPHEFEQCDGTAYVADGLFATQQYRKSFGLCYRTKVGNDTAGPDLGYKIHLVYNATAEPTTRDNKTVGDSLDASIFTWDVSTVPVKTPGIKPTAHFVVDSTRTHPDVLAALEDILYGSADNIPTLPTQHDLVELFVGVIVEPDFIVVDNGDGSFTITAPDEQLTDNGDGTFVVTGDTVIDNEDGSYTVSSE